MYLLWADIGATALVQSLYHQNVMAPMEEPPIVVWPFCCIKCLDVLDFCPEFVAIFRRFEPHPMRVGVGALESRKMTYGSDR